MKKALYFVLATALLVFAGTVRADTFTLHNYTVNANTGDNAGAPGGTGPPQVLFGSDPALIIGAPPTHVKAKPRPHARNRARPARSRRRFHRCGPPEVL